MQRLTECAQTAVEALEDLGGFIQAVDTYGAALDQFGAASGLPVFSEAHRRIAEIARRHGRIPAFA